MLNTLSNQNIIFKIYCLWATIAIFFAVTVSKNISESITRVLVIIFLAIQFLFRNELEKLFFYIKDSKKRFVISGTILASFVEGFHMISTPVFLSLRVDFNMSLLKILENYFIDLIFTIPAYIIIFSVIWYFINKYQYSLFDYILTFGLSQSLGDGGIFYFIISPFMLFFIPYPMTNYHAINIIPFLFVKDDLNIENNSLKRYLAIPSIILTYLICGSIIKILGNKFGFS